MTALVPFHGVEDRAEKISARHLEQTAVVYIRQSSRQQVHRNRFGSIQARCANSQIRQRAPAAIRLAANERICLAAPGALRLAAPAVSSGSAHSAIRFAAPTAIQSAAPEAIRFAAPATNR
jgi:hypothetical protein